MLGGGAAGLVCVLVRPSGIVTGLLSSIARNFSAPRATDASDSGVSAAPWYSRFEKVLAGGLGHGVYNALPNYPTIADLKADPANRPPISGGSDAPISGVSTVRDIDGPPKPPHARKRPGEPVALLGFPIGS